jgi:hypothetical protein
MNELKEKESEIIKKLLTQKKALKKKQDFYHRLFHKYEWKTNFFLLLFWASYLFTIPFRYFQVNKWALIIFLVVFLINLGFLVYFSGYYCNYQRKLEKCSNKINQINEKLIKIMVPTIIATNPMVQPN